MSLSESFLDLNDGNKNGINGPVRVTAGDERATSVCPSHLWNPLSLPEKFNKTRSKMGTDSAPRHQDETLPLRGLTDAVLRLPSVPGTLVCAPGGGLIWLKGSHSSWTPISHMLIKGEGSDPVKPTHSSFFPGPNQKRQTCLDTTRWKRLSKVLSSLCLFPLWQIGMMIMPPPRIIVKINLFVPVTQ